MAVGDFPEGATATHKDGRKIVFRDGEWRVDQSGTAGNKTQLDAIRAEALDKIKLGRSLQQRSRDGWFVTGFGAGTSGGFGGSAANDVRLDTETLKNAGALQRVMQLSKDNGGKNPLTPLSNSDFQALSSSLANLDTTQSDEQYQRNVQRVIDLYQRAYEGAGGADLEGELSGTPQAKGGDQASGAPGATGGSGTPPTSPPTRPEGEVVFNDQAPETRAGSYRLTSEQEAYISGVAQKGGTPEEIIAAHRLFGKELAIDRAEAIFKAYQDPRNRDKPLPFDYSKDEAVQAVDAGDGAAGARARGLANGALLGFDDEIGGTINAIANGGNVSDEIDRLRGQKLFDEQNYGGSRFVGQVVGGLPLGGVEFGGARAVSRAAGVAALRSGLGREVAMMQANRAFAMRSALEGAAIGGVYGAGEADGGVADRALGASAGAAFGGAAAGTLTLAGGAVLNRRALTARGAGAPALTQGQEVTAAAARQDVELPAAYTGGSMARRASGVLVQTPGGTVPLTNAANRVLDTGRAARDRIAATVGQAADAEVAGENALAGATRYIKTTARRIGRVYDQAAAMSGDVRLDLPKAVAEIDDQIARLEAVPGGGAGLAEARSMKTALEQGGYSVQGVRDMRTEMFVSPDFRGTPVERRMRRIVDAASEDIEDGLRSAGNANAADAFASADRQWRERLKTIERVIEPIVGRSSDKAKSGEEVVAALQRAAKGNGRRLEAFVATLSPDERGMINATMIGQLGRATDGEGFSFARFKTDWAKIGERTKAKVFGPEVRAALNDLTTIAKADERAGRFLNRSNTGSIVAGLGTGATLAADLTTLGGTLAAQYGAGWLLASPKVARWLARAPKQANPAAQRAWVERLSRIARSEPAIAQDVTGLQAGLRQALGMAPARAAAETNAEPDWIDRYARENSAPAQGAQP